MLILTIVQSLALLSVTAVAAPDALVASAVLGDGEALAALRAEGPGGLARLQKAWQEEGSPDDADWHQALDAVAGQRDAARSGLYWYTDLEEARAASARTSKPIVSLRLLGKLTDELSCANSRFFRTVLYADPEVSAWLRERAVLHWSSERPVPIVTVDYGDGRRLKRTITGNSAHFVLDQEGRVLELLPGLYGPDAFLEGLEKADGLYQSLAQHSDKQREGIVRKWHANQLDEAQQALSQDLMALGLQRSERNRLVRGVPSNGVDLSGAWIAMQMSTSKAYIERPLLYWMVDIERLPEESIDWTALAALHPVSLDPASLSLIASEEPLPTVPAQDRPQALARLVDTFEKTVAEDTVRNEYQLHAQVHRAFREGQVPSELDAASAWLYNGLFETPREDLWMGLFNAEVYTGLYRGGVQEEVLTSER